ncbi:MAG: hypothetical protein ACLFWL_08395 [Candidatus Brocadiia bacterium]
MMLKTVEAEIDTNGRVKLLEPLKLDHPCHAIVTIIDEDGPEIPETALLSEKTLARDWERPEEEEAWAHLQ